MTRSVQTTLLLGVAMIALSACGSSKGPGELGSKNDIVVRNNGMPGEQNQAPLPPSSDGDGTGVSSTVENVQPNPAASVDAPESLAEPVQEQQPLPSTDPAIEQAAQQVQDANAPVPAAAATPMNDGTASSTAPVTETVPADVVAPEPVVQQQSAPAAVSSTAQVGTPVETTGAPVVPDDAPQAAVEALGARKVSPSSVYPATDYPPEALVEQTTNDVPTAQPAPQAQPVATPSPSTPVDGAYSYKPLPAGSTYKADPNAPYSPSAAAAVSASAETAAPAQSAGLNDAATIKAVQAALKLKGVYTGPETGAVDAAFLNALVKYQSENGLPVGGVNAETLRNLGIAQ